MKPAPFQYSRPSSVAEAVTILAAAPDDSKVLAGGQSLIPLMNFRLVQPRVIVDVNYISGLAGIRLDQEQLSLGALTRVRALEQSSELAQRFPLLVAASRWVGHVQIRNRGTVGGTIAHADPAAEIPAICMLTDAVMRVASSGGTRTIPADDFFRGFLTTALHPDEMLVEIVMPLPPMGTGWGFTEYAQRRGDFALAGAACLVRNGLEGAAVQIVAFGPGRRAVRCHTAESVFKERDIAEDSIRTAAAMAVDEVREEPTNDPETAYRYELVGPMVVRSLQQALSTSQVSL
ncbi:MAG: FAD binding domain-containing protein [Candidatus Dormiibacterota bacterium]